MVIIQTNAKKATKRSVAALEALSSQGDDSYLRIRIADHTMTVGQTYKDPVGTTWEVYSTRHDTVYLISDQGSIGPDDQLELVIP